MSPPAQNDFPTARTTRAPTSGLASTSSNVAISSSAIAGGSALRGSGSFSSTIAPPPSTPSSPSPDPPTTPPLIPELPASLRALQSSPRIRPRAAARPGTGTFQGRPSYEDARRSRAGVGLRRPIRGAHLVGERPLTSAAAAPAPRGSDRGSVATAPGRRRRNGQVALDPLCS